MDEEDGLVTRKYQVRAARQIGAMEPVPKSPGVEGQSQDDLWPGVAAANSGHHSRPGFTIDNIRHGCVTRAPRAPFGESLFRFMRTGPISGS